MLELEKAKEQVAFYAKKMSEEGLVLETWGNASVRVREELVITPSGLDYRKLNFIDMVVLDLHGNKKEGRWKPSSESPLHCLIYRNRKDVNAIMHTHSLHATSFAVARKEIKPVVEDFAQAVGSRIEVTDYALPGTDALAMNCVQALGDNSAVLLSNHGVVAVGNTLEEVLLMCKIIEKTAQISIYASMLGGPHEIEKENVKELREYFRERYGQK